MKLSPMNSWAIGLFPASTLPMEQFLVKQLTVRKLLMRKRSRRERRKGKNESEIPQSQRLRRLQSLFLNLSLAALKRNTSNSLLSPILKIAIYVSPGLSIC